jgi:cytochrome c biogenesis protein CcdA
MSNKEKYLSIYLYVFGFASIFLITTIPIIWGDLLLWQPRNLPTEIMMASIYLAMGIIMVLIAKKPLKHKSFIDFLILSNLFHASVMLVTAHNFYQIIFDFIPIALMGVIPLFLYPWRIKNFLRV